MKVWLLGGSTAGLFFNNLLPNLSLGVTAREQVRDMRSISIARRRLAIALLGVLVITSWTTIHTGLTLSTKSSNASSNLLDSNSIGPLSSDQCNDLQYHESGHWRHQHFYGKETANVTYMPDTVEKEYLHKESYWLRGHALPVDWVKEGCKESASTNGQGLMYVSTIGNQCGCNADGFRPSHSTWSTSREYEGYNSASVQLVRNLARYNRTLCFMGDSIDLQFYTALQNNLRRVKLLQDAHGISNMSKHYIDIILNSTELPIVYTNETGFSWFSKPTYRKMDRIMKTEVSVDGLPATFMWIKMYGWAPMHTSFAGDCSVVIGNLGLHYDENSGEMHNAINILLLNTLSGDLRAFLGWMLDFTTAGSNRLAIWRSALPQHFDTPDGHYVKGRQCSPLAPSNDTVIQKYNRLYDAEFAQFCSKNETASGCEQYEHVCTENRTSLETGSLYRFYVGSRCCEERRQRLENEEDNVKARIRRWNIADIFDVSEWHVANSDCSHFCYVPQLYDTAFERLLLLLKD